MTLNKLNEGGEWGVVYANGIPDESVGVRADEGIVTIMLVDGNEFLTVLMTEPAADKLARLILNVLPANAGSSK